MKNLPVLAVFSASLAGIIAGCLYVRGMDELQLANLAASLGNGADYNFAVQAYTVLSSLIPPLIMAVGAAVGYGIIIVPICMFGSSFSFACSVSALWAGSGSLLLPLVRCALPNLISLPFVILFAMRLFETGRGRNGRVGVNPGAIRIPQAFAVTAVFCVLSRAVTLIVLGAVYG